MKQHGFYDAMKLNDLYIHNVFSLAINTVHTCSVHHVSVMKGCDQHYTYLFAALSTSGTKSLDVGFVFRCECLTVYCPLIYRMLMLCV